MVKNILIFFLLISILICGCDIKNNVKPREGALQGTVYDVASRPLSLVYVYWQNDINKSSFTDKNGKFFIDGIGFGEQTFVAQKDGYKTKTFKAYIYSNAISTINQVILETASFEFRDIKVENISATSVEISWKTTEFTNGHIEYGETEAYGATVKEPDDFYSTTHRLEISDLKPATKYFFKIVSSRKGRLPEVSAGHSFTTTTVYEDKLPPKPPVGVSVALTSQPNCATVFWIPNSERDLKGYKIYKSESAYGTFYAIENVIISKGLERYTDSDVIAGKKYFYRVTAIDLAGNESSPSETVSILVPGVLTQEVVWYKANSPYLVSGDIIIDSSGLLRIEPGVEVLFDQYDSLRLNDPTRTEIIVNGGLIAKGELYQPIVFSSNRSSPQKGDWKGIIFNKSDQNFSEISWAIINYADIAVTIAQTNATFTNNLVAYANAGLVASNSSKLYVTNNWFEYCNKGIEIYNNNKAFIFDNTFYHCKDGILSFKNFEFIASGNNVLNFTNYGLFSDDHGENIFVYNNLFVSHIGLGMLFVAKMPKIENNTLDCPYGIRIQQANPIIRKNILVTDLSPDGIGVKGIEFLQAFGSLPNVGPNCVYGFPSFKDYIGCIPASGSLSIRPNFIKDISLNKYDYRPKNYFPSANDIWGIIRTYEPGIKPTFY